MLHLVLLLCSVLLSAPSYLTPLPYLSLILPRVRVLKGVQSVEMVEVHPSDGLLPCLSMSHHVNYLLSLHLMLAYFSSSFPSLLPLPNGKFLSPPPSNPQHGGVQCGGDRGLASAAAHHAVLYVRVT